MATNKKYKLTDGNMWATDGIYDFDQDKTQRQINSDLNGAITKDSISSKIFNDSNAVISNLNSCVPGANFYNINTANIPIANTYGTCYDLRSGTWHYQIAVENSGKIYIRTYVNGWSAWKGLNTVEEGTVIATSNLSGLFDKVAKKQGNVVNLFITTNNGTSATLNTNYEPDLATVPVGFRPSSTIFVPAVYYLNGTVATVTLARITSAGQFGLLTQTANTNIGFIRLNTTYFV